MKSEDKVYLTGPPDIKSLAVMAIENGKSNGVTMDLAVARRDWRALSFEEFCERHMRPILEHALEQTVTQ
jgi:hypothetical protein